jgi:soluble lytic murein transglycosylase
MTRLPTRLPFALVAAALALAPAILAAQTPQQGRTLARALDEAREGNWTTASSYAGRIGNRVAADIVLWTRLREGVGGWQEYAAFIARNADWPGLAILRRHGERKLPPDADPDAVIAFFGEAEPVTGTGALRLAEARTARGHRGEGLDTILRAWPVIALTRNEQDAILDGYGDALAAHHVARLDNLLWNERLGEAELMLPLVDDGWRALAEARIGLRRDVPNATQLVNAVPARHRADPGMAYERFQFRVRRARWDEAEAWIDEYSASAATLGRPEMWMPRRHGLARQALRRGEDELAYRIAARNFGTAGSDFAEAEWLAGYIALTRLDDPLRAIGHFMRFEQAVATPISLGRAGYWLGLAHEAAGQHAAARVAFRRAGRHQTSFYGQLAAERARMPADPSLAGNGPRPDWRNGPVMRAPVVRAGYFLHLAGEEGRAMQFFRHAAESMDAEDRAALAQMQIDLGRTHLGVRIAKDAAAAGIIIPRQYYPSHPIARADWPVPTEFALAVARQESEFNPAAISHAGARGLMQLMPATAQQVAERLGLDHEEARLLTDPMYNARLGTTYLGQMLTSFGGSYILAAAAYNAGPGRVRQWLADFGDPRDPEVDPVLWIEAIPFNETRNYVMRVLEALHVYRARLEGRAAPIQLVADINRTG